MGSKLIHIQTGVYLELASFKDDERLKSFTAAIRELLKRNRQKYPRVDMTAVPHSDYEGVVPPEQIKNGVSY